MRFYFMGICGTAMGNAALMLRSMGYTVCGADTGIYPPMSDLLGESGIELYEGYDAERLERIAPDVVVVGNVVSRGHPEMEWLLRTRTFRYVSLPALLAEFVLSKRRNIVVSGTHGKTTTSTLAACLLQAQQGQPQAGYLIGGVPLDLPSGACAGAEGAPFVIEGDEYDSAFFDKRSKFIHYLPNVLVMNNLEFDHADIFRDLQDIKRTFSHVMRLVPSDGFILVNAEDANLASLVPVGWTQVISVGTGAQAQLQIRAFEEDAQGSRFELWWEGALWAQVSWKLPGMFNARNAAMAALAAGLLLHPEDPTRLDLSVLGELAGVKRRQEILLETQSVCVLEDFGHHPTALGQTLESLRARYAGWHIRACFEPRSNTARTQIFQERWVEALVGADSVYLGAVHRAERMEADERLDTARLCEALEAGGVARARAFEQNTQLLDALLTDCAAHKSSPQLLVFFSNGSFDGLMPKAVAALR